jgi:hypothetical protein
MKELTINLIEEVLFWNHLIGDNKTNGEPVTDKMNEALTYAQQKLMFHLMDEFPECSDIILEDLILH